MKRIAMFLLIALLLSALPVGASVGNTDQLIEITAEDDALVLTSKNPTTFWETPNLRPGETMTADGQLAIVNNTDTIRHLSLKSVALPYDDPQALEYLNHLTIVLKRGDDVLYDGTYSAINGAERPNMTFALAAGDSVSYTIQLRCDYTYAGDTYVGDAILDWEFDLATNVSDPADDPEPAEEFSDPLLTQWLFAGIATVILFAALLLYRRYIIRAK